MALGRSGNTVTSCLPCLFLSPVERTCFFLECAFWGLCDPWLSPRCLALLFQTHLSIVFHRCVPKAHTISRRWLNSVRCVAGGWVAKLCPTLVTPRIGARQAPLSMGFSRQQYWSGSPFPSPGDLPNSGTEPGSPALQADSLPTELRCSSLITSRLVQSA